MFEGLYVLELPNDTWQLRILDSHFCISSVGSEDRIYQCIKNMVIKYRSEMRLLNALHNMDGGYRLSEIEMERVTKLHKKFGHVHEDLVRRAVREANEEIKMDSQVIRTSKKFKKVNILGDTPPAPPVEEEKPIVMVAVKKPVMGLKRLKLNIEE